MTLPSFVTASDVAVLSPSVTVEQAEAMIRAVTARAVAVAPCIAGDSLTEAHQEAVRAVILDAVTRWVNTAGGAAQSMSSGPFQFQADTRQERRGTFLKSEFDDLRSICDELVGASSEAFSINLYHRPVARIGVRWDSAVERGWVEP